MGILVDDGFTFGLVDREFYETLDRYRPQVEDFIAIAKRRLGDSWEYQRSGIWFNCRPPGIAVPPQGWKIHLSSTISSAAPLLATVIPYFERERVAFKFALDRFIFRLLHGKNWQRGGSGKFVTIYPSDQEHCRRLLDGLYQATTGFSGPYILSDRRYRDSTVVHYRYGGIQPTRRLTVRGESVTVIRGTDGGQVDDQRNAFFHLPDGVTDPFCAPDAGDDSADATLKNGRYKIETAITFTNSGGVYLARDTETGEQVIVKEARPHASQSQRGSDAVISLRKEHRLLSMLDGCGVAPRPIDFFRDWEHYYLVEEFVEGQVLRGFTAQRAVSLLVRPNLEHIAQYVEWFRRLYALIARAIDALHQRGITFSDLSHYNVIVAKDAESVRLIDFEGAYELGVDTVQTIHTPGFAPRQQIEEGSAPEDDNFALGGLMLAGLMPVNGIFALNQAGYEPFLDACVRDLGFPPTIASLIRGLLNQDRAQRPSLTEVIRILGEEHAVRMPKIGTSEADGEDLGALVRRTLDYAESTATFDREDRLFPAGPAMFQTNPMGLAHGAAGVAYALQCVRGRADDRIADWILARDMSPEKVPPGLYVGRAGISWALLELGRREDAERLLRSTWDNSVIDESPDLYHGLAGWGMTQLRFFIATGNEEYLAKATQAGRRLMAMKREQDSTCFWVADGVESCGLGHGAAGISLFLLYLSFATRDDQFADAGRRALRYIVTKGVETPDGGLTWRIQEGHPTVTPYWRWGSAGIGAVMLRYRAALGDSPDGLLDRALAQIDLDCDRKFSIFPGLHLGLAGIGEFYLDQTRLLGDRSALDKAKKLLSGVLLFKLARENGIAFPGETRTRITCDLASGGPGIALFAHRFLNPAAATPLMLDELLGAAIPASPGPSAAITSTQGALHESYSEFAEA